MKRPYIAYFQRRLIEADTLSGAFAMLELRWKQLCKSVMNVL